MYSIHYNRATMYLNANAHVCTRLVPTCYVYIYVHTYEVPTYVLLCCIIRKVLASSTKCTVSFRNQLCTVQNRLVCIMASLLRQSSTKNTV